MFETISEFRLRNPRGSYFTTVSPRSIGQLGELQIFKLESYSFAVNTFVLLSAVFLVFIYDTKPPRYMLNTHVTGFAGGTNIACAGGRNVAQKVLVGLIPYCIAARDRRSSLSI